MIAIDKQMDGALLEVEISGRLTAEEYETTLVPAVEAALAEHDRIRVVAILWQEFEGFDLGAAWADTKMGLSHWSGFDRIALVTDTGWIKGSARVFAPLMPCPVQVFELAEAEEARRWIRESLGAVHFVDLGGPGLMVQLVGKLEPAVIEAAEEDLEAEIRARDGFRLLLDLTEFDGWHGLSALMAHASLVRDHSGMVEKAAVVGDSAWQHMAQRVMSNFLKAETRFFDSTGIERAKKWLKDG
ncbi:STAS/SEC14 domain-containing protein [Lutimaribacter marinistellae]|uniref:STAS/SEC14 domain-containing protein n=1 Tax=Lutimaribacter marinistellae TaxID=1820329 RepID=A0ABV7TM11_9RHOB